MSCDLFAADTLLSNLVAIVLIFFNARACIILPRLVIFRLDLGDIYI